MRPELATLIADLSDPAASRRVAAARSLAGLGPDGAAAASALARTAGDADEQVREWAVAALEELGAPPREELEALCGLLRDSQADIGYWSATLLGRLGAAASPAVPALADALANAPAASVRQRAAWALGRIGAAAAGARGELAAGAQDPDERLARLCREALERLGA